MAADLRGRAIRLLARRERSRAELQRKLDPDGSNAEAVARLLDQLQIEGWLSESRLAEQFVNGRRHRASAGRIRQELKRRGVAAATVAAATTGLEADDLRVATALWQRRFGTAAADRSGRERQLRFLLARGFGRGLALRVLRDAGDRAAEEFQEGSDE